ncbi:Diphthamide biosynthesis protein 1 [Ascochyta clinopodiicola]|nr:Diphthamide biosynthesis protein 1 [Ascochyta clinopodiicola]
MTVSDARTNNLVARRCMSNPGIDNKEVNVPSQRLKPFLLTDITSDLTTLTNMGNDIIKTETEQITSPGPLLVFVLGRLTLPSLERSFTDNDTGAPCSGKSTLCTALAMRYNLDHFCLGDELRSLVSGAPSSPASRIKHLFSDSELETFRNNLYAGTLGPVHLTPKYVKERVFPANC